MKRSDPVSGPADPSFVDDLEASGVSPEVISRLRGEPRPYLRHMFRELARGAFIATAALAAIYALAKWWGLV